MKWVKCVYSYIELIEEEKPKNLSHIIDPNLDLQLLTVYWWFWYPEVSRKRNRVENTN